MLPQEKIDEWIQEVQKRPSSAPIIIQYIANRLRDLNEWNKKLKSENIKLRSGQRVEEYERTITHLEYQLELLKRQVSIDSDLDALPEGPDVVETQHKNLLVYSHGGRVARVDIHPEGLVEGSILCRFDKFLSEGEEPPRIRIVSAFDELMFIFTSGRIINIPVAAIPLINPQHDNICWDEVYVPEEPNIGETLAAIVPISLMALADFFVQISRRGFVKKIRTALAANIMDNQFIGTGVKVPADQTMTLLMGYTNDCFILVSHEGYLQSISESMLPYAIVEAMHLGKTDHLVAAFPAQQEGSILVMTQIGKVIHRDLDSIKGATDLRRKGNMLYTIARREAGVRVIGGAVVKPDSWAFSLHTNGQITQHPVSSLIGRGAVEIDGELLDFVISNGN